MTFRKAPPPKPDRSAEFASYRAPVRQCRMSQTVATMNVPVPVIQKTPGRKQQSIRDSARGEECSVRIVGACNHDPETTVWSHMPELAGGRGMGLKAVDLAGAYACSGCHDVVDGRKRLPPGASPDSVFADWCRGHFRSLERLLQKGLV